MKKYILLATTTLLCVVVILFTPYTYSSETILCFEGSVLSGLLSEPTSNYVIDVPSTYNGQPITTIKYSVDRLKFNDADISDNIVGLNLDDATNLTTINKAVFKNCKNLAGDLNLPQTMEKIGSSAFAGTKIEKVYVHSNVTISPDSFPDETVFVFASSEDKETFKTTNASDQWKNLNERLITNNPFSNTSEDIKKYYGETIDLTINESGDYSWYNESNNLIDTSKSIRLTGLSVGTYTYSYEVKNAGNLVKTHTYKITIEKAKVNLTFIDPLLEYTGNALQPVFNTNLSYITNNYFNVDYYYFTNDYTPVKQVVNAGKYKMVVSVKSEFSDNILILNDSTYVFSVGKKIIDVEWNIANSMEYTENYDPVSFNPVVDYASCKLLKQTSDNADTYEESVFGIGRWKAVLTLKDAFSNNYELSSTEKKFSITPCELIIQWPNTNEFSYDGHTHTITPTLLHTNNLECSGVELSYSLDSVLSTSNAGKYAVKVTKLNNPNYKLSSTTKTTFEWKISQRTIEVRWSNYTLYYNGTPQAPTAMALDRGLSVGLVVTGAEVDANEGAQIGYVATAKLDGSNQNYILTNATTTYFILKKTENFKLDSNLITKKYDGNYLTPSYFYDGTQPVLMSVGGIICPSGLKEIGEYVVKMFVEETNNIKGNEEICVVRILPAELTANTNDVMVEVEGVGGFEIGAKLTIGLITENHNDASLSKLGNNLNLIKMVRIGLQDNASQNNDVDTIRFRLNNVDTSKLHIFTLTNGVYNECKFSVENGFIVMHNAKLGTYAFMIAKSNWFAETGIWLFGIFAVIVVAGIVLIVTFKKPIKEKIEQKVVNTVEKVYEENYVKKTNEQLIKTAKKHAKDVDDDDDFDNMHDNE